MKQPLENEFNDFLEKIALGKKQRERIISAVDALSEFLADKYELTKSDIYVQGSFSTGTTTKPAPSQKDGEYDVDLVIICAHDGQDPGAVLDHLVNVIKSNEVYKDKIENRGTGVPCVRLRYADEDNAKFHVDLVPAKSLIGTKIAIPRRNTGWEESNPLAYASWIKNLGDNYRRTLMYFRRWRDENEVSIKSVVLQVLVAEAFSSGTQDSEILANTFLKMKAIMEPYDTAPVITNPVLPEENLSENWKDSDFKSFKEALSSTCEVIEKMVGEESHDMACTLWQGVLGEDFIYQTDKEFELGHVEDGLADINHVQPLIFPYLPKPGLSISLVAITYDTFEKKRFSFPNIITKVLKFPRVLKSGQPISSGKEIVFSISINGANGIKPDIYWQVVNTGEEAARNNDLRGKIYPSTSGKKYHYESTKYCGTHWIEFFAVHEGKCISRSGRFYVPIFRNPSISRG